MKSSVRRRSGADRSTWPIVDAFRVRLIIADRTRPCRHFKGSSRVSGGRVPVSAVREAGDHAAQGIAQVRHATPTSPGRTVAQRRFEPVEDAPGHPDSMLVLSLENKAVRGPETHRFHRNECVFPRRRRTAELTVTTDRGLIGGRSRGRSRGPPEARGRPGCLDDRNSRRALPRPATPNWARSGGRHHRHGRLVEIARPAGRPGRPGSRPRKGPLDGPSAQGSSKHCPDSPSSGDGDAPGDRSPLADRCPCSRHIPEDIQPIRPRARTPASVRRRGRPRSSARAMSTAG